jgi:hypothetical protein
MVTSNGIKEGFSQSPQRTQRDDKYFDLKKILHVFSAAAASRFLRIFLSKILKKNSEPPRSL